MKPLSSDLPRPSRLMVSSDITVIPASLHAVSAAIVNCQSCDRLRRYCGRVAREKKPAYRDDLYWGRPVPGFGDPAASVLLVGLAPAAHGANRTGRPFTGDGSHGSSAFLMSALFRAGFANQPTSNRADDGLILTGAFMAMAVRCAPPDNTPRPEELTRCLAHLDAETACLPRLQVVVALGRVAFNAWLRVAHRRGVSLRPRPIFEHGAVTTMGRGQPLLIGCYHPSRQNTNTGRLTPAMLDQVLRRANTLSRLPPGD
jgi:uracil-DNA glycosylase family 4